jgi:hypothetical protein
MAKPYDGKVRERYEKRKEKKVEPPTPGWLSPYLISTISLILSLAAFYPTWVQQKDDIRIIPGRTGVIATEGNDKDEIEAFIRVEGVTLTNLGNRNAIINDVQIGFHFGEKPRLVCDRPFPDPFTSSFEPVVLKPGEVLYTKLDIRRDGKKLDRVDLEFPEGTTNYLTTTCLEIRFATPDIVGTKKVDVMRFDINSGSDPLVHIVDQLKARQEAGRPRTIIQRTRTTFSAVNFLLDWTIHRWCALRHSVTRDYDAFAECTGTDYNTIL